jgi:flagellar motor switch protein FliN/FliY
MNTAVTADAALSHAQTAAQAAVALLPASTPLSAGTPSRDAADGTVAGQAVRARFAGAAQGEIVVVVGQDLVDALASTPMGALDVTQAVRPALEAAAATLGPVSVDPGDLSDPTAAIAAILAAGGALVPLTDPDGVRAVLAIAVASQVGGAGTPGFDPAAGTAAAAAAAGAAAGFTPMRSGGLDLLHDVEMEVTAELGRTRMSVRELLSLTPGAVIELDRAAGGPADLLVNGRLIARGEVVIVDENFGIRITEIVGSTDRA